MAKRGETKRRIVKGAREAFNTLRYGQVTTALLAERLGISEGNLWYHFATKRDMLTAIQAEFLSDTRAVLAEVDPNKDSVQAYCDFLVAWRDLFARYLFVFRDRADYGAHSPDLIEDFPLLYLALEDQVSRLFVALVEDGHLHVDANDIPDLVFNTVLVTRFHFEFLEERGGAAGEGSHDAVLRHQTLLKGRMSKALIDRSKQTVTGVETG